MLTSSICPLKSVTSCFPAAQPRFDNRVGWAASYLKQAGLLEGRGSRQLVLTQSGRDLLAEHPTSLSVKSLERYPQFLKFKARKKVKTPAPSELNSHDGPLGTPEEALETAWQELREELAKDLLAQVRAASPAFFEHLVLKPA